MAALLCISGQTQTIVNTIDACLAIDANAFIAQSAATLVNQPTLQDIFAMPISSDLQQMWLIGFSYPVSFYLISWSLGLLINMFNTRDSH
jgi:hypothetical protein